MAKSVQLGGSAASNSLLAFSEIEAAIETVFNFGNR